MTGKRLSSVKISGKAKILGGALVVALGAGAVALPAFAERGPGDGKTWRQEMRGPDGDHGRGHGFGGFGEGFGRGLPDFATLDADGDGRVTEAEITAYRQSRAAVDTDGDGKISKEELVAHELTQAEARIRADVDARMAAQDLDGDGMLSAEELLARPMPFADKLFERLDADGDGAVTEAEVQAARDAMRERMAEMRRDRDDRGPGREGRPHHRMPPPPPGDAPEAAPDAGPDAAPEAPDAN